MKKLLDQLTDREEREAINNMCVLPSYIILWLTAYNC